MLTYDNQMSNFYIKWKKLLCYLWMAEFIWKVQRTAWHEKYGSFYGKWKWNGIL